jgi:flagellar hook-associated protein 2
MSITNIALPGLSGYDFSGIVEAMVSNYSLPLGQMQQRQTTLEAKKNAWRDINTRLSALENTLEKLRQAATWTTTSASSGNAEIISAKSAAGTVKGSYNIQVTQLAVAQTVVSNVQDVAEPSSPSGVPAGVFRITVGEKTADIRVSAGDSLQKIAEEINNAKIGVNASVIKVDGGYRLAVLSAETGTAKAATFSEVSGNVLKSLGILDGDLDSDPSTENTLNISQEAKDAKLIINGITAITSSSNTVTSAIPGLTLTLNKEAPGTNVTVKVSADYSEAQKAVQAFVDQYNSVMTFIQEKLKYNKDLNTKGDLFADPVLQGIQSRLRSMVAGYLNNPTGPFKILADVGISTSAADFGKSAALQFDTAKFMKAMEENPESVANLFGASAGGVDPVKESTGEQKAQGLANIMREYLHPLVMYAGTLDETQKGYERQINDLKKQIEVFTDRVAAYAERTRLRFSILETQLMSLGNQNLWLQGQINALNAFNQNNKR